jgi:hypothetical protein
VTLIDREMRFDGTAQKDGFIIFKEVEIKDDLF